MQQAGTYNAHLKRGVLSKSKGSGSLQYALIFDVSAYLADGQWAEIEPFERTVFLSMAGDAKDYTKKKLATLGYTDPTKLEKDESTGEQVMVFADGVSDTDVQLLCKHEDYQGQSRERWDLANWGGSVTGEAADDEDVMKIAALW